MGSPDSFSSIRVTEWQDAMHWSKALVWKKKIKQGWQRCSDVSTCAFFENSLKKYFIFVSGDKRVSSW